MLIDQTTRPGSLRDGGGWGNSSLVDGFDPLFGGIRSSLARVHHPLASAVESRLRGQDGHGSGGIHVATVVGIPVHRREPPHGIGNRIRLALVHDHSHVATRAKVHHALPNVITSERQRVVHERITTNPTHGVFLANPQGSERHLHTLRVIVVLRRERVERREDRPPRNVGECVVTVGKRAALACVRQVAEHATEEPIRILCQFDSAIHATTHGGREPRITSAMADATTGAIDRAPRADFVPGQVSGSERERIDWEAVALRHLEVTRGGREDRPRPLGHGCALRPIALGSECGGADTDPVDRLALDDGIGQDSERERCVHDSIPLPFRTATVQAKCLHILYRHDAPMT